MFDSRNELLAVARGPKLARLLAAVDVDGLDADATLTFLSAVRRQEAWTESLRLDAAARFAELHDEAVDCPIPGAETLVHLGGEGTPACGSFTADELGPGRAMSRYSAARLIADALDLKYRLPAVLMAVRMGGTTATGPDWSPPRPATAPPRPPARLRPGCWAGWTGSPGPA